MHITVVCPSCQTRYHLKPEMLGKMTRCPNAVCRATFEVRDTEIGVATNSGETKREGPPPSIVHRTGSVGEIVPFLEAEPELPTDDLPDEQSWQNAPPVRIPETRKKRNRQDAPPPVRDDRTYPDQAIPSTMVAKPPAPIEPVVPPQPLEMHPGDWETPPVRINRDTQPPPALESPARQTTRRRRTPWVLAGIVLVVFSASGGIVYWAWNALAKSEAGRYRVALEQFNDKQYVKAESTFALLESEFPDSERASEYKFRRSLSQALQPAFDLGRDSSETLAQLQQFVKKHQSDPLFKPNTRPIGEAFDQISKTLAIEARHSTSEPAGFERARLKVAQARHAGALADRFGFTPNASAEEEYAAVESAIVKAERRINVLNDLRKLDATAADIGKAEKLAARHGLSADLEIKSIIDRMKEAFQAQVTYVPGETTPIQLPTSDHIGLVVVSKPPIATPAGAAANGVMFAIARGVLYALAWDNGALLWAARVGVDTTALPVRVPATETLPELALIWSADATTLSAREVRTGQLRWQQPLSAPGAGNSVLVGRKAYVGTHDGKLHEIDVDSGRLLGAFQLGSAIDVGGVHEVGTDLLYIPASGACVYVLDLKQRKCVGVIQTGHPTGSLRCPLLLARPDVSAGEAGQSNYLVLCQADGPWATRLRAFHISSPSSTSTEAAEPEPLVQGWPWFAPSCDGEKIALATDAGTLGLFGINQPRNQDTPLFRMLPENPRFTEGDDRRDALRAQVVYARDRDFWVLIGGRLRHLQLAMDSKTGLRLLEAWSHTTPLGHPVQSAQVDDTGDRLFLVTQPSNDVAHIVTAVAAPSGKILWQHRLGLNWHDGVMNFNGRVLALDRDAGLFEFDPSRPHDPHATLQPGGTQLAAPSPEQAYGPAHLLESPDGNTACVVVASNGGTALEAWRYEPNHVPVVQNMRLASPLHGTPALGNDYLLLPLADGSLLRQPLDGKPGRSSTWRSARADRNVTGHALHLGPNEFLITDGARGISRWTWPPDAGSPKEEIAVQLTNRIVGTPALLPPGLPGSERFIALADATGVLRLLKASDLGAVRSWDMKGKITDGPYAQATHLACVTDGNRLMWIDPTQDEFWEYVSEDYDIIGRPQVIKDLIVVADRSGRLVGVDPISGKPVTSHLQLTNSASAATAPFPFGEDRLLVPMTDGTATVLPLSRLRTTE